MYLKPKPFISAVAASVKIAAIYTCIDCNKTAQGTTVFADDIRCSSLLELDEAISAVSLRTAFPVGWASCQNDVYRCPEHKI